MMKIRYLAVLFFVGALCGCGGSPSEEITPAQEAVESLAVATVNYPLAYFAERIGGDLVDVLFPCPAGDDPAYWAPDAETIILYQKADLILLNGAGYAKWIDKATLPSAKMVDTSAPFGERLIPLAQETTHSHGPGGKHEHTGTAFTTWLDLDLAIEQAKIVTETLVNALPAQEPALRAASAELESDLMALDQRLTAVVNEIGDLPLVFSHPVYQYLEKRYGLNGRSVHWEPGDSPDMDELKKLVDHHPAQWVVWEGEPLSESVALLESAGIRSVVFDPCGNRPTGGDFLSVMTDNVANLNQVTIGNQ